MTTQEKQQKIREDINRACPKLLEFKLISINNEKLFYDNGYWMKREDSDFIEKLRAQELLMPSNIDRITFKQVVFGVEESTKQITFSILPNR